MVSYRDNYLVRFGLFVVLFIAAFFLPAWLTFLLASLVLLVTSGHFEYLLLMVILDSAYSSMTMSLDVLFGFWYTIFGILVVLSFVVIAPRVSV